MSAIIAERATKFKSFSCGNCNLDRKKERGCFGFKAAFPYWSDTDGDEHDTCPRRPLMHSSDWFSTILLYYSQWEKGFLPERGGINDQTAKYAETMTTVKIILNDVDEANRPPPPKK